MNSESKSTFQHIVKLSIINLLGLAVYFYHLDLFYFIYDFLLFSFVITFLYVRLKSPYTFLEPKPFQAPVEYITLYELEQYLKPFFETYEFFKNTILNSSIIQKIYMIIILLIIAMIGLKINSILSIILFLNFVIINGYYENSLLKIVKNIVVKFSNNRKS